MLHHDNAPADASLLIHEFLTKHETSVVPQPLYSPDLAPADFFLFPKLKSSPKGRRIQTAEEIEENSMRDLCASGSGVSRVEGSTLKETSLIKL